MHAESIKCIIFSLRDDTVQATQHISFTKFLLDYFFNLMIIISAKKMIQANPTK